MYSKEGWACPPLPFIHFWLFFFSRAKNYCKEFVLILFVYQAFEPNSIKNIAVLKIQNQSTQKQNKLGKHIIIKTCQYCFCGFCCVFSGESCRVVFGDFVFWLCFCFWCVSLFARINFLCWSRCQTTRANEQNFMCIQPNLTRTTSNYNQPRNVFQGGVSLSPPIHTFSNFLFPLIQKNT